MSAAEKPAHWSGVIPNDLPLSRGVPVMDCLDELKGVVGVQDGRLVVSFDNFEGWLDFCDDLIDLDSPEGFGYGLRLAVSMGVPPAALPVNAWIRSEITNADRLALALALAEAPRLTEHIAESFLEIMRSWLTPEELVAVDAENERRGDNSCASHDYCDPNMAMLEAMERFNLPLPADENYSEEYMEEHCALWNEAWDIAKSSGFSVPEVTS